jgi:hypothetical protein
LTASGCFSTLSFKNATISLVRVSWYFCVYSLPIRWLPVPHRYEWKVRALAVWAKADTLKLTPLRFP